MTANLVFDPVAHAFTVDGQSVPGVTSILKAAGLGVDYSKIPPATLEWARMRGTHIDECCTLLDEGCLDWASVADEAKPYVEAWQRFTEERAIRPTHQQPTLYHPALGYCGIADVMGVQGLRLLCIERKATDRVYRSHGLQLAAYTMPGLDWYDGIDLKLPVMRVVVQLLKTGKYKAIFDGPDDDNREQVFSPRDWDTFTAACVIARWKGLV